MKANVRRGTMDEMLIRREFYNPNSFAIRFELMKESMAYVHRNGIMVGPMVAILPPDSFVVLPHAYYRIFAPAPVFDLIQNFGDQIGKGNKRPSLPIVEGRRK